MSTARPERRECPAEYQDAINQRFGLNRFGEPNFKIVWGQTEKTIVAGVNGYEERLLCRGAACWNILRWKAPECYGSPESWYMENYDPETNLCLLGPYPEKGRYEIIAPLMNKEIVDGKLFVDAMPLNYVIIDKMIPLILKSQELSALEILAIKAEEERLENERIVNGIADRLSSELPTFYGPVSYAGQQNRTALITRKMDDVEKVWRRIPDKVLRNPRRGVFQTN